MLDLDDIDAAIAEAQILLASDTATSSLKNAKASRDATFRNPMMTNHNLLVSIITCAVFHSKRGLLLLTLVFLSRPQEITIAV